MKVIVLKKGNFALRTIVCPQCGYANFQRVKEGEFVGLCECGSCGARLGFSIEDELGEVKSGKP